MPPDRPPTADDLIRRALRPRPVRRCRRCRRPLRDRRPIAPRVAHYAPTFEPLEVPEDCRGDCCEDTVTPVCCPAISWPTRLYLTLHMPDTPSDRCNFDPAVVVPVDFVSHGATSTTYEGTLPSSPTCQNASFGGPDCVGARVTFQCSSLGDLSGTWFVTLIDSLGASCNWAGQTAFPVACGSASPVNIGPEDIHQAGGGGGDVGDWWLTE